MKDIVERLRDSEMYVDACDEAARLIEEQRKQLATLRARVQAAEAQVVEWRFLVENKPMNEEQAIAVARCADELEAALKAVQS